MPICATIAQGLALPIGPATTTSPHSASRSSEDTSRKLTLTPVTKFSASAASRKPQAAQASQSLPALKWKRTNQTMDRTTSATGTCAQRSVAAWAAAEGACIIANSKAPKAVAETASAKNSRWATRDLCLTQTNR